MWIHLIEQHPRWVFITVVASKAWQASKFEASLADRAEVHSLVYAACLDVFSAKIVVADSVTTSVQRQHLRSSYRHLPKKGPLDIVIKNGTGARCSSLEHLKTYSMRTWTHWMKSVQHTLLRASVATSGKRTFFCVFLFEASHFSTLTPQLLLVGGQKKWLSTI